MIHRSSSFKQFSKLVCLHDCIDVRLCVNDSVLPQGWYSLGLFVEDGFKLPLSVLIDLGISELYLAENSELLSTLYKRCV